MRSFFALQLTVSLSLTASTALPVYSGECGPGCVVVQSQGCSSCGELPAFSICSSDCNSCQLPECGICGTNKCWDCSGDEGIDLESLTPEAKSKKLYEASMARIMFVLPDDAGVSLLDQKMSTLGPKRSFVVSVNDQSKDYKYEIKVDVVRGGKKYFRKLKINDLRAGMILAVAVEAPPVPDGEPAEITLVPEFIHKGGKPVEDKTPDDGIQKDEAADPDMTVSESVLLIQ